MAFKKVTFNQEARTKLKKGVDTLAKAVKITLGPKGRNVIINKPFANPVVTKDGVTVASEIILEDYIENLGAQVIKQAAAKTAKIAGDGTTTSTILAQAIIERAEKLIAAGANPIDLKRGIEKILPHILEEINKLSEPVTESKESIEAIATISANNDAKIGKLIAEAMDKVTKDGVILVQESKTNDTYTTFTEGMQLEKGFISPYFVNTGEHSVEYDNPLIVLINDKVRDPKVTVNCMNLAMAQKRPLVIIGTEVEAQALESTITNKLRGIPVVCVKAPYYGEIRTEFMKDLAIATGATLITKELGISQQDIQSFHFGSAEKIIIDQNTTTLLGPEGPKDQVAQRLEEIKAAMPTLESDYMAQKYSERMANLIGGLAILHVGAATDAEMVEKKHRIDDALQAVKAAIRFGTLPGGGTALLHASANVTPIFGFAEENLGAKILLEALTAPAREIINNAGKDAGIIMANVVHNENINFGYNANTDKFGDMREMGIIDPTLVVTSAIENAVSAASMIIMTECTIHEEEPTQAHEANPFG
jgi:chaperonin GroEL